MIEEYKRQFYENKIEKADAYWINPRGKILALFNDDKHIHDIIKNPEAYNLTLEQIKLLYTNENEQLGGEGKAREKIIKSLISQGWIRIRKYSRDASWTINIHKLDKKTKDYLQNWAEQMIHLNTSQFDIIRLDLPNEIKIYTIQQLKDDILYLNESISNERFKLKYVKMF